MSALPHQGYPEDKRHMSLDNGPQQNMYRQPSFPPQTPMAHGQPYDYPPHYGHHGDLPYIQIAPAAGKRKAQRASQVGLGSGFGYTRNLRSSKSCAMDVKS